jgi:hypothetical protein
MDAKIEAALRALLARQPPVMGVMALAGGGSRSLVWLLGVGGASGFLLEAIVPYGAASMIYFLDYRPDQFASPETARAMARRAYCRALALRPVEVSVLGVACTAALVTTRPRRGDHRCHVAAFGEAGLRAYSLTLTKGARARAGEEDLVSRLVLRVLAEAVGCDVAIPMALLKGEQVQAERDEVREAVNRLLRGQVHSVTVEADGTATANRRLRGALLPGSFNPLHQAHLRLAEVAGAMLNMPVSFELSTPNVDKPPLSPEELMRRLAQFACETRPVILTRAPLYVQKAALFPGCVFVVGCDTAARLFATRYYGGSVDEMYRALEAIQAAGCRFLVAGRADEAGAFRTLEDIDVPEPFRGMLEGIPEKMFRMDTSSTKLRRRA